MTVHKKPNLGSDRLLQEVIEARKRTVGLPIMERLVLDLEAWAVSKVERNRYANDKCGTSEEVQDEDEAIGV